MKYFGRASRILGIDIERGITHRKLILSQRSYIEKILAFLNNDQAKTSQPQLEHKFDWWLWHLRNQKLKGHLWNMYHTLMLLGVWCMQWLVRGLILHMGLVCRYMSKPSSEHWRVVQWLFWHLKCSASLQLTFERSGISEVVEGYSNSNHVGDRDKKRPLKLRETLSVLLLLAYSVNLTGTSSCSWIYQILIWFM